MNKRTFLDDIDVIHNGYGRTVGIRRKVSAVYGSGAIEAEMETFAPLEFGLSGDFFIPSAIAMCRDYARVCSEFADAMELAGAFARGSEAEVEGLLVPPERWLSGKEID